MTKSISVADPETASATRTQGEADTNPEFHEYMRGVARARCMMRKVARIVDQQAKRDGLDPLEHQALVQVYAARPPEALSVQRLAERVDVSPALASRLINQLEGRDLVVRAQSDEDMRVKHVIATASAVGLLQQIDARVRAHLDHFQMQLDEPDKLTLEALRHLNGA